MDLFEHNQTLGFVLTLVFLFIVWFVVGVTLSKVLSLTFQPGRGYMGSFHGEEVAALVLFWPVAVPIALFCFAMGMVMCRVLFPFQFPNLAVNDDEEEEEDQYLLEARREVNEMFPGKW